MLGKADYTHPTTIQAISWPVAMSGRDLISIARTGSGKTLAFMLPALMNTKRQLPRTRGSNNGPGVLVIAPTRELVQQVEGVSKPYCHALGLEITSCYGGSAKMMQEQIIRRGNN